jgi:hypothetical protein
MAISAVCCLLVLLPQPETHDPRQAVSAVGFCPSGAPAELYDLGLLARLRDPGVRVVGFSSYDRTGGNNDGFSGTYSRIRAEGGDSVLAEVDGPGIVQRIWFTHTSGEHPGLLDGKQEHIKIYIDGLDWPVLDVPLEAIFGGTLPHFPRPLVLEASGGFVSYVPIPFQNGCKIVVQGLGVRFYQIGLVRLPAGSLLASFTAEPTPEVRRQLVRAAALWSVPAEYESRELQNADLAEYDVEGLANSTHQYVLRAGPATIRSFEVVPAAGTEDAWSASRLRIAWDDDEAGRAGVDLPLGQALGRVEGALPYHSLLLGQRNGIWYNRFPMPYRRQAIVRIDAENPLKGKLRVRTLRSVDSDAAFFHAAQRRSTPTRPKEDFTWLKEQGRGHFAGILLSTDGKAKLPYWLEGDDRFRIDGRLAIHGTGTEDYFNCGWYALRGRLDGPAAYAVHGFPVYLSRGDTWQAVAYRWHLSDPVPYSRSIEAGIEHGGDNTVVADYRAAVYWYSQRPDLSTTAD